MFRRTHQPLPLPAGLTTAVMPACGAAGARSVRAGEVVGSIPTTQTNENAAVVRFQAEAHDDDRVLDRASTA